MQWCEISEMWVFIDEEDKWAINVTFDNIPTNFQGACPTIVKWTVPLHALLIPMKVFVSFTYVNI